MERGALQSSYYYNANGAKKFEIGELKKELEKCFKDELDMPLQTGKLIFSSDLLSLINEHSSSEKGKALVDKTFNNLNSDLKNKTVTIEVNEKGLKYFPILKGFDNLEALNCYLNELNELDLTHVPQSLKKIDCSFNKITEIIISEPLNNLEFFSCACNKLSKLRIEILKELIPDSCTFIDDSQTSKFKCFENCIVL